MHPVASTVAGCAAIFLAAGGAPAGLPMFTNIADQAGVSVDYDPDNFPNIQYGASACAGDFNNDGFQDLYVCSGADEGPDHLFINDGDGTFTDRAAEWGCNVTHDGKGIAVADYNGDGWLDVYVVSAPVAGVKLWRNNGGTSFTNVAAAAGIVFSTPTFENTWFGCWGDYDLDGDLDLFSAGHHAPPHAGGRLFRNNGNGTFTDATTAAGIWTGIGTISAFAGSFTDMNGDRYPELLVTADFECSGQEGSQYWINDGDGTFTLWTDQAGVGLEGNGMGQTRGDFNNDGLCDWYTTTIFGLCSDFNRLYRNNGAHSFTDVASSSGVGNGGYGWGAIAVDINNDGLLDIGETNGPTGGNQQARLFINDGAMHFTDKASMTGLTHNGWGRSMIHFDLENDGDQDIVIHAYDQNLALFRNDLDLGAGHANWLRIFLDTSDRPDLAPSGYGSRVSITANGKAMHRWVDGGNSYLGISELSAHFGLGSAAIAQEVRVLWNSGEETVLADVAINQTLTITPPIVTPACPADLDASGAVGSGDLNQLLAAFGQSASGDVDGDGDSDSADLNLLLAAFGQPCA